MNTIYLNGIYQAKSENLINEQTLLNFDKSSLINHLKNLNYGNGSNYLSFDNIINYELRNVRNELRELSSSNLIGDIFYLDEDLTNFKIVFKSIYYNIDINNENIVSRFDVNHLYEFFKNNNDSFIDIKDLDVLLKMKDTPSNSFKEKLEKIEIVYYEYIYNKALNELPFIVKYLETKNFNKNMMNFLKLKTRNDNVENLNALLLPQVEFDKNSWIELFELNNDQIIERLSGMLFGEAIANLKLFFETKNIDDLKKTLNDNLTNTMQNISYDLNNLGGVFYYLHLKLNEINNLRRVYYESK